VADSDGHTSLLRLIINYCCKVFNSTGPPVLNGQQQMFFNMVYYPNAVHF